MWKSGEGPQRARTFYPHGVCEETQVIHSRFRPAVNSPVLHKIFLHNPHPLWIFSEPHRAGSHTVGALAHPVFSVTLWAGSHTWVPLPTRYRFLVETGGFFGRSNIQSFVGAAISRPKTSETELPVEWNKLTLLPFNQAC